MLHNAVASSDPLWMRFNCLVPSQENIDTQSSLSCDVPFRTWPTTIEIKCLLINNRIGQHYFHATAEDPSVVSLSVVFAKMHWNDKRFINTVTGRCIQVQLTREQSM